jgi:predicted RNA-binding Zn-ribbon protein involved in translation (DUF1610 family)
MGVSVTFIGLPLFAIVMAIAAWVIVEGIVGRAVPVVPCCAKCGHGVALVASAVDVPCAECGSDLARPEAIRYFRRRWRPGRVVVGIAAGFAAFALPVIIQFMVARPMNIASASTSMKELTTTIATDDSLNFMAINEAIRREAAGELSDADRRSILDAIVARHERVGENSFLSNETEFLAAVDGRTPLADEVLAGYLRPHFEVPSIGLPETIRVPFDLSIPAPYTSSQHLVSRDMAILSIEVDGTTLPMRDGNGAILPRFDATLGGGYGQIRLDGPPGPHRLRITFEETFRLAPRGATSLPTNQPPRLVIKRVMESPLTYARPDDPTWLALETPPNRAAEVERACSAEAIAIDATADGTMASIRIESEVRGVSELTLAFEVLVVIEDKEYPVAHHVVSARGTTTTSWDGYPGDRSMPLPKSPLPRTTTVIFRPKPTIAESLVGVDRIWGGEVRREGIPIITDLPREAAAKGGTR